MIGTTNSKISDQLRYIYSICRCCWNVATHKWKVHNEKIYIIFFCRKVTSDFYKVKISTNYEKIILIFVVLSIALARLGTILRVVREITRSKKNKNVNF